LKHSNPKMLDTPFAFRLARESVGKIKASYRPRDSRRELLADPAFREARLEACERIRLMDIRFVEELLEIYVVVSTGAPHNDFNRS
jgi:hypothetical protein